MAIKAKKSFFVCAQCGCQQPKWMGRCPDCGAWNSFGEEASVVVHSASSGRKASIVSLTDVVHRKESRLRCGIGEFDRVLGGGLVPGSLVLLSGDPGIGKSTLLLQALNGFAASGLKVLYASGEESGSQIRLRAERLGTLHSGILLTNETDIGAVLEAVNEVQPHILVIDSIQTMYAPQFPSSPGTVTQIRECTNLLLPIAKGRGVSTIVVGHVTKEGNVAGPRVLEHLVDTVLYLEGDHTSGFRILRGVKNRFGSTGEIGVFSMHDDGLAEVSNPSKLFLESHRDGVEGSAVAISMEGTRPLLVEVQALVGKSTLGNPRRYVTGLDANRFAILTAVLEKRAGLYLGTNDIYANIAGGLRLFEPAIDLALAAAVASSLRERAVPAGLAYFGEVGLSGEVRAASHALQRIQEALKMGFERIYVPSSNYRVERDRIAALVQESKRDVQIYPVENVSEVTNLG